MDRLKINYFTSKNIFYANLFITSSQSAFILKNAYSSKGVFCKLIITNLPFCPTILGICAAGVTVKLLPIDRHKSAKPASSNDLFI